MYYKSAKSKRKMNNLKKYYRSLDSGIDTDIYMAATEAQVCAGTVTSQLHSKLSYLVSQLQN